MRSGAESEDFTVLDALKRANLMVASNLRLYLVHLACLVVSTTLYDCLYLLLFKGTLSTMCSMQLVQLGGRVEE